MNRRRVLALAIVAVWLGTVAWHIKREYFRPELAVLEEGARGLAPGSYFYAVHMNGAAIGTATSRLDTIADGFTFDDNIILDIPALDTIQRAVVTTRVELDRALALRRFRYRMVSDIGSFSADGVVHADSVLELEVGAGGDVARQRVALGRGITFDPIVPIRLAAAGQLRVGSEVGARIFDPSSMEERELRVRITETSRVTVTDTVKLDASGRWVPQSVDTLDVWKIEQSFGGVTLASWVDEDGMLVRATSPLGFVIERTAFEIARQELHASRQRGELSRGYGAVIEATAIASNVELAGAEPRDELRVRLKRVGLSGFDLDGGRQRLHGDTLIVTRETRALSAMTGAGYTLPYDGGGAPARELGETLLIQSRDARIVGAARAAVGGTKEPGEAARLLNDWVYGALRKQVTPSLPSAVQVLAAKRGDCNEHTVLYVALARALGLPARPVAGLVHVRGRFYYHAWPEVWFGGEWIAVDPTLRQFPADASHLRFVVGGLARQVELLRLIGRLELEVL
jgi:hypothetical protein